MSDQNDSKQLSISWPVKDELAAGRLTQNCDLCVEAAKIQNANSTLVNYMYGHLSYHLYFFQWQREPGHYLEQAYIKDQLFSPSFLVNANSKLPPSLLVVLINEI